MVYRNSSPSAPGGRRETGLLYPCRLSSLITTKSQVGLVDSWYSQTAFEESHEQWLNFDYPGIVTSRQGIRLNEPILTY